MDPSLALLVIKSLYRKSTRRVLALLPALVDGSTTAAMRPWQLLRASKNDSAEYVQLPTREVQHGEEDGLELEREVVLEKGEGDDSSRTRKRWLRIVLALLPSFVLDGTAESAPGRRISSSAWLGMFVLVDVCPSTVLDNCSKIFSPLTLRH
jgi:hypothetical protein